MNRSTDQQVARLRRQVAALQAKVRGAQSPAMQRSLLVELIGVAYALQCAQATIHRRPSNRERRRTLAALRAEMERNYAGVLAAYLPGVVRETSARSAAPAVSMGA